MIPDASKVQRGNLKVLCKKSVAHRQSCLAASWERGSELGTGIKLGLEDQARTREQAGNESGMVKEGHIPVR